MPRRARSLQDGDYYHVLNRGSVRARLFYDPSDYEAFLRLLGETVRRFELPLLSYCIMPNHWHLVVRPATHSQLSRSLHWLTCTHAVRWCRVHERKGPGPVYQGRFKSIPVEAGRPLMRVCRYVERNAHAANLTERAEEWHWSSANQRLANRQSPALVAMEFLIANDWLGTLNTPRKDRDVARAIRQSRPFGSKQWAAARVSAWGLSESGARGRPKARKLDRKLDPSP